MSSFLNAPISSSSLLPFNFRSSMVAAADSFPSCISCASNISLLFASIRRCVNDAIVSLSVAFWACRLAISVLSFLALLCKAAMAFSASDLNAWNSPASDISWSVNDAIFSLSSFAWARRLAIVASSVLPFASSTLMAAADDSFKD